MVDPPAPADRPNPADERVADQPAAGRVDQFSRFYRTSTAQLIAYLMAACGASLAEAAECAQDTMVKLYARWAEVNTPIAWCRKVARTQYYRRLYSAEESFEDLPADGTPLLNHDHHELEELENQLSILRLLKRLPSKQREVMALAITGLEPAEIANELGVPCPQVRANLKLARQKMAKLWPGDEPEREV